VASNLPAPYRPAGRRHMARLTAVALPAVAAVAALSLAACSSSSSTPSSSSSTPAGTSPGKTSALPTAPASATASLSETGSTLLYPLFNLWAPAYKSQFPQVTITTAGTGSGTGISSAAGGTADIGASDAYLSSSNMTKYPTLENIPLAISAQEINYNLPGIKNLKLNGTILAGMYQGKISYWDNSAIKAINPGVRLPHDKVVPLHRSDSSGDTFLFTTYLSKQDSSWGNSVGYNTTVAWPQVSTELAYKGNSGMVTGCKNNVGCIAYIGISYDSSIKSAGLQEAMVENGAGQYELPTPSTIGAEAASFTSNTPANGAISLIDGPASGAYPIINYEYAIVNSQQSDSTKATDIKALLNWILTSGQSMNYLSKVNFQPLPSGAVAVAKALAEKIS
jgi:phosphate transport system substrate-binding protein